jgi:hypothetical protein
MWQRIKIMNPNNAAWFNTKLANFVGPLPQAWTIPNLNHCLVLTTLFQRHLCFRAGLLFRCLAQRMQCPKGSSPWRCTSQQTAEIAEKKKVDSRISYLLYVYVYIDIHVYIYIEIDTYMHANIHTYRHTDIHTDIQTYSTDIQTYIQTRRHTWYYITLHCNTVHYITKQNIT